METPRQLITIWAVMVVVWNPVARATDPPRPTPTPRPGTLAALAKSTSLSVNGSAPVVITDDNLSLLAEGAVVTVMTSTAAEFTGVAPSHKVDPKRRDHWRRKVLAQSKRIATLEQKRSAVEGEINSLERGRLDARALDRITKAEARLREIDVEIRREKNELSKIVREARKEGAEPGWFR